MFPTLFHIDSYAVHSYGFFIALGYLVALAISTHAGRLEGIAGSRFTDLAFIAISSGLVGGRILFVLTNLKYFLSSPLEILYIWQGGLVFFGGLVAAIPAILLYVHKTKLPVYKTLDILTLGLVIGHAFGRIGCLGAGCCHGAICTLPWGVKMYSDMIEPSLRGMPIHPTQLYEAIALFVLFIFLWRVWRKGSFDGQVSFLYLMLYSVIRSVIEVFRGDSVRGFVVPNLISTSQAISILVFLMALWLYQKQHKRSAIS